MIFHDFSWFMDRWIHFFSISALQTPRCISRQPGWPGPGWPGSHAPSGGARPVVSTDPVPYYTLDMKNSWNRATLIPYYPKSSKIRAFWLRSNVFGVAPLNCSINRRRFSGMAGMVSSLHPGGISVRPRAASWGGFPWLRKLWKDRHLVPPSLEISSIFQVYACLCQFPFLILLFRAYIIISIVFPGRANLKWYFGDI